MPEPEPQEDEGRQEFIGRCVSDEVMQEDYPDVNQRLAVCGDIWDERDESSNQQAYNTAQGQINE